MADDITLYTFIVLYTVHQYTRRQYAREVPFES